MEAVVITAEGKEEAAGDVEVIVEYVPRYDRLLPASASRAAWCIRVGPRLCVRRKHSGYYRLTARSGDAAPAVIQRFVWSRGGLNTDVDEPELSFWKMRRSVTGRRGCC